MTHEKAIKILIAYSERSEAAEHANKGLCPDVLEGHESRDPDCVVCQALMALEAK